MRIFAPGSCNVSKFHCRQCYAVGKWCPHRSDQEIFKEQVGHHVWNILHPSRRVVLLLARQTSSCQRVMAEVSEPLVTLAPPPSPPLQVVRRPTLPASQKDAAKARREEVQAAIDADVQEWLSYTVSTATKMSNAYDKPQAHFMSLLFHMGLKMSSQRKPNVHNAWLHSLATTENEGQSGVPSSPHARSYSLRRIVC